MRPVNWCSKGLKVFLANPRAPPKDLSEAIIPLMGIRWNREVRERVGSSVVNHLLYRLRNSLLPPPSRIWKSKSSFPKPSIYRGRVPHHWEQWLTIIEKFELDNETDLTVWIDTIFDIRPIGFETPWNSRKRA